VTRQLKIGDVVIDDDSDCFVIAEIGHNHQGDLDTAKAMIKAAVEAGADAVKLQKRDNASLFTREFAEQVYNSENSFGSTYREHRAALELGREEYEELIAYSNELGTVFFATAFDVPSADFLHDLDVAAIKIASGDLTNTPLLRHVAERGRPMVVSTGGARMEDVERAYELITAINPQLALLQCTAGYPPAWEELNLRVITTFRERFPEAVVGFSSHDSGIAMAVVAYTLGARVIEKHFTLNRAMKGTDQAFSLEPTGMRKLVRDLRRTRTAMGDGKKATYASEEAPIRKMAKKLVAARGLPAGHRVTASDVALRSPGDGMAPYLLESILGRELAAPMQPDDAFGDHLFVDR